MRLILASMALLAATAAAHADGDPAKGKTLFKQCMACHSVGPNAKTKVGPPLNGIVGAKWAHYEGYAYSKDIKDGAAAGKVWDKATLDNYLTNPKVLAPHGKMSFAGFKKEDDRENVIAYLSQFNPDGSTK